MRSLQRRLLGDHTGILAISYLTEIIVIIALVIPRNHALVYHFSTPVRTRTRQEEDDQDGDQYDEQDGIN